MTWTAKQLSEEQEYRFQERLGILCGPNRPTLKPDLPRPNRSRRSTTEIEGTGMNEISEHARNNPISEAAKKAADSLFPVNEQDKPSQIQRDKTARDIAEKIIQSAITESTADKDATIAAARGLAIALKAACIASCECGVKTPEAKFHSEKCRYGFYRRALEAYHAALYPEEKRP